MTVAAHHETLQVADSQQISAELGTLSRACGTYQSGRKLFSVSGKDRVRWLNGMVSNNIRDLATGYGVYAFVLNAQGRIQGDLYAFNQGESLVLELEGAQSGSLLTLLRKYIIMDKVEIQEMPALAVVGVTGPTSRKAVSNLQVEIPDLGPLQTTSVNWMGMNVTVVRGDNPHLESYELWAPADTAESLIHALTKNGAGAVSSLALEQLRILCGIPKFGQDIRERTLPQETGQERALNFSKGCYIGQEIVERIRARGAVHRVFTGFGIRGRPPAPGQKIQRDGNDVGEITSVAALSTTSGEIPALGFLRREFLTPDAEFELEGARLRVKSLPFDVLRAE